MATLFDLCMHKTASLLCDCYWPLNNFLSSQYDELNPFVNLPPHVNEELLALVTLLKHKDGQLHVKHLYPLLSSGRIRNFTFENTRVSTEDFVAILAAISVHAFSLQKLILRKIYFDEVPAEKFCSIRSTAIECLLSLSPNLEYLETDKDFDLKALQKIPSLKHLELNFPPKNKLFDILPKIDDYCFVPGYNLSYISVFEGFHNRISPEEVAFLLQYCPKLTVFTSDIAGALELLHGDDLYNGILEKRYELQRYILGDALKNTEEGVASVDAIHIATIACPMTKSLDVLLNSHQAVSALSDFRGLESLLIQWENPAAGDFRLGLGNILQSIGPAITDLSIINFSYIDFEVIGLCCPELKALKVEYDSELDPNGSSESFFTSMESLHLQCEGFAGVKSDVLLMLLSNCKQLVTLNLGNVLCLTDEFLQNLLQKNDLSKLRDVLLTNCSLTADGLRLLIERCRSLDFLSFESVALEFEDAVNIVHQINPFVMLNGSD